MIHSTSVKFHSPINLEVQSIMEDIRRRKGKVSWDKSEGETKHEKLWTLGNNLGVIEGRGFGDEVTR